jgi:hypothetical protein
MRQRSRLVILLFFILVMVSFLWYAEFREPAVVIEGEWRPLDFNINTVYQVPPEEVVNRALENRSLGVHYTITSKSRMDENVSADSWEELWDLRPEETYLLTNFGESNVTVLSAHVEHKPISIKPFSDGAEPYTITVSIEPKVLASGEEIGLLMKRTFNCTGTYEITSLGVDYLYEGKKYSTDLNDHPWLVNIYVKNAQHPQDTRSA